MIMNRLFDEFDAVSAKSWKQKIQVDLKGRDYHDSLIWQTAEGIDVKPFYHSDDEIVGPDCNTQASKVKICQSFFAANALKTNKNVAGAIQNGVTGIHLDIPEAAEIKLKDVLADINTSEIPIFIDFQQLPEKSVSKSFESVDSQNIFLNIDLIGHLARTGNWYYDLKRDHEMLEAIVAESEQFKSVISVDMALYQNAGANMVQQLAYGLSHANEYLNHFGTKMKLPINFKISTGSNYFFEIAKLRALRLLWKTLAGEYNIQDQCHIFVRPSKRNKTIYDYNNNMLRTTTECMSAIIGGSDTICNLPYDALYHKSNSFGERIARNQLLILKNESGFTQVDNPADGAYYIDSLTNQLAEKALVLFKDIESNGGFLNQLKAGTIQRKIKESAEREQHQFNANEIVLLGTNKHPNASDRMQNELELYPFIKTNKRKTLLEPIIEKRLSEGIEKQRLQNE